MTVRLTDRTPLYRDYSIDVNVRNNAPNFITPLVNKIVPLNGTSLTYTFPTYKDLDGGIVTLSILQTNGSALPSFITFTNNKTIINPGKY